MMIKISLALNLCLTPCAWSSHSEMHDLYHAPEHKPSWKQAADEILLSEDTLAQMSIVELNVYRKEIPTKIKQIYETQLSNILSSTDSTQDSSIQNYELQENFRRNFYGYTFKKIQQVENIFYQKTSHRMHQVAKYAAHNNIKIFEGLDYPKLKDLFIQTLELYEYNADDHNLTTLVMLKSAIYNGGFQAQYHKDVEAYFNFLSASKKQKILSSRCHLVFDQM